VGEIALTPNEWMKARRFKEQYWLYVIENATTNPTLRIINNPVENLRALEKKEVVRFVIPYDELEGKTQEVWRG
jgi:hypothetical protein